MREHSVLRRTLIVYAELSERLRSNTGKIGPRALADAAKLFREFGEDYHEHTLGYAKATAAGSWLRSRERQAGRAARLEEPLQEHRREDAKQHGDHERQPMGHGPLPLTLTLLWIGFRAFALMPLHTPMVSRSSVRDKRVE